MLVFFLTTHNPDFVGLSRPEQNRGSSKFIDFNLVLNFGTHFSEFSARIVYMNMNMESFFGQDWWVLIIIALWSLPWKGVALWKASKRKDKKWFIAILILNTVGILEILYIFIFSHKKDAELHETNAKKSER